MLIAVLGGSLFAALTAALRLQTRAWTHPACLFALFWTVMTILPMALAPDIGVSPWPLAYLLVATAAFGAPAFFQNWSDPLSVTLTRANTGPKFSDGLIATAFVACQLAVLALIAANLDAQGFPIWAVVTDPIGTGCKYLAIRYGGIFESNVFSQSATILNYVGAAIAGLILPSKRILTQLGILLLAMIPSLLNMLLYADKGTVFLALSYLFGAVLVARISAGDNRLLTWRTIAAGMVVLALLVPASAIALLNKATAGRCSDAGRSATVVQNLADTVAPAASTPSPGQQDVQNAPGEEAAPEKNAGSGFRHYARSYALGHFFAFSDWFNSYAFGVDKGYTNPGRMTWGFWTFMAVGHFVERGYVLPAGYFDEYYKAGDVLTTNIYTMYRGMIYDFGIAGSLVFMAVFGWVSSLAYRHMLAHENAPLSQAYYIFLIGFIYTSYIISLLIWKSSWAVPVILWALLWLHRLKNRGGAEASHTLSPAPRP